MSQVNDHLVLVCGKSAAGKSASLMNLRDPENVVYLNCESGKRLPFPAKFRQFTITDPYQVYEAFTSFEEKPEVHTIVIDSLTYLMDMFHSVYVLDAEDGRKAWGQYAQFFKNLMQQYVARSSKKVVFTAHVIDQLNEQEMVMETKVPVKGGLKDQGLESYFSCVIAAKKVPLKALEPYSSDLLTITPEEQAIGLKYVFQTKLTADSVNERLRGPMGLFSTDESMIDNDLQAVLDRLDEYYGPQEAAA